MRAADVVGYVACALVFLTFYMKNMAALRSIALLSNLAFVTYGGILHLLPILLLHVALIPVNICRLISALRDDEGAHVQRRTLPPFASPGGQAEPAEIQRFATGAVDMLISDTRER